MIEFILSALRYSTPLLFVSIGVLFMEVAGVVIMGAEGIMIVGCLSSVVFASMFNNVWLGCAATMVVTALFAALFACLVIELKINQVVMGVAFNLVGYGLTTTLNRAFFNGQMVDVSFAKDGLGLSAPVYIAILLVVLTWVVFYKTKFGVQLRSVGENPKVVESVGISVKKLRYIACAIGGALIGMGGVFLSTGILNKFTENMTGGRGYIALAAVTFGKYGPFGTLGGVLVFGLGEAIAFRLQAGGGIVPYEFALMLPYVLTVVALCVFSKNSKDPMALGVPYFKSK